MQLFVVIIALGFLQVWGANNPLHKDAWFLNWITRAGQLLSAKFVRPLQGLITVFSVSFSVAIFLYLLGYGDNGMVYLTLPFSVVILLYSLGRGEFGEIVTEYTRACYVEDWQSALERARPLGVVTEGLGENDWPALHEQVLNEAAYRGFERMFSVLFWFYILGPFGALSYRLLFIYLQQKPDDNLAARLLWILEWPVARILGLSFCFTGNFVGCYSRWRETLFCLKSGTRAVLSSMVRGALSVDDELTQTCEVTRKELNMVHRLYARSLWFWLASLAVLIILT